MSDTAKTITHYLNEVDYSKDYSYTPSEFALEFVNFIKLLHGDKHTENKTPVIHYKMLDNIQGRHSSIANMCFRGVAKSTLFGEYLFLYLAVFGSIPGFGVIDYALYLSDSIDNGVKKMRLRLQRQCENSAFLKQYLSEVKLTDIRWYFKNQQGKELVVTGHGAQALSLDTILFTQEGHTTIGEVKVGDRIYGSDGKLATVTAKSVLFNKPMYEIELADGRNLKVSEDHLNSVYYKDESIVATTKELLEYPLYEYEGDTKKYNISIENIKPIQYPEKVYNIDPYSMGLLIAKGEITEDNKAVVTLPLVDIEHYRQRYPTLTPHNDKFIILHKVIPTELSKGIPEDYLRGSYAQRLQLLKGIMDIKSTVTKHNIVYTTTTHKKLAADIIELVRSLGGAAYVRNIRKEYAISITMPESCFTLPRYNKAHLTELGNKVNIVAIHRIANEPSQCIAVNNMKHEFIVNDYIRTHNTGVRGTVELGTRPQLAVLDDLISDEDAKSPTVIARIEDTVYSAVDYAMHPNKRKIIWSGTPFNAKDPLYKAVESGVWKTNIYPVCEKFPCTREEFRGAWEDRFDYDYVHSQYMKAKGAGKLHSFNQELMLRIMSDEERLVGDADILWYSRDKLMRNKHMFNFYITTDFATSSREHADFSTINVWGYSSKERWYWVDGFCKKALMPETIDNLFKLVRKWEPQEVGIEISGQQGAFIAWIQQEMQHRELYFSLSKGKDSDTLGIRPNKDKMSRFQQNALPLFSAHKIFFPTELKETPMLLEMMEELSLATYIGFKSKHDDQLDTISMLAELNTWAPSSDISLSDRKNVHNNSNGLWGEEDDYYPATSNVGNSYFV